MRTDYAGHDRAYQRIKAEGKPGWATTEQVDDFLATVTQWIEDGYLPKNGKLLELGCGDGANAVWLAERGYEVSGVDIAPTAIAWAQEKAQARRLDLDLRVGNVLDLKGYPDNAFDFVVDGHCFHCIIGEDRKLFAASARRVLKSGGILFICSMCGEPHHPDFYEHFDPQSRCMMYQGDLATRYIGLAEEMITEIETAGFRIIHWEIETDEHKDGCDNVLIAAQKP